MKKLLLFITLLSLSFSAWALEQDGDGYYLIGSAQDWQDFAALVQTNPSVNARMTADIDLGNDNTVIGSNAHRYAGTFDGQGFTLTVNYNTASMGIESGQSYLGAAPFRDIEGATICNLHTTGTITADKVGATGLVGWSYGTNVISCCWSDVNIVSSNGNADTFAGFVFRQDGTRLDIQDCHFSGKIQSSKKVAHGGFIGHHYSGNVYLNHCLLNLADGSDVNQYNAIGTQFYTFVRWNSSSHPTAELTKCYYTTAFGVEQGTATTAEEFDDGTTAANLQDGRSAPVWVQDPVNNVPMLAIFANDSSPVTITDGEDFTNLTQRYTTQLTYTRGYNVGKWASWFVPFAVSTSDLSASGLSAAYINGIHQYDTDGDGTIDRTEVEVVKIANGTLRAGTPYLVKAAEGYQDIVLQDVYLQPVSVTESIHTETAWTAYDFEGSYSEDTSDGGQWSLDNDGALVKRTSGATLLPMRWRMTITQKSGSPYDAAASTPNSISIRVIGEEDVATGIRTLYPAERQTVEQGAFDVLGRRVAAPTEGINIVNGRKVIVR